MQLNQGDPEKTMNSILLLGHLLGRILLGLFFLMNGVNHFINLTSLTQYAAAQGVPLPTLAVMIGGVLLLFAGVTLVLGYLPHLGVLAVVLFFAPVNIMMHDFWALEGEAAQVQRVQFMKNMAITGGALMALAIPLPWPKSIGPKRRL